MKKNCLKTTIFVAVLVSCLLAGSVNARAEIGLNLDGVTGSGVIPNAFVVPSEPPSNLFKNWEGFGTPKIGFHYVNLDSQDLTAYHITKGFKDMLELGYTKQVVGSSADVHVFHGKFQFLKHNFKGINWIPAMALGAIHRKFEGNIPGDDYGTDYYLSATKIIPINLGDFVSFKFAPTVGVNSTKAIGNGLFGFSKDREEGFQGIFEIITEKNFIFGVDFKSQPESDDWIVYFLRYNIQPNLQVDFALGNLGKGRLHNQFICGISYRF